MRKTFVLAIGFTLLCVAAFAEENRPMSPTGVAEAQVLGKWVTGGKRSFTLGGASYEGGQWIEIRYGRPLKRGRNLWGAGENYGKDALVGAPLWRAGANVSTRLKTPVPLVIGDKTVPAGEYSLFIDLKENHWTLVVSSWAAQPKYDPADKTALWGAYNYTPDKDVARIPMKLETLPLSIEQLTWEFVDMTEKSGVIALVWDTVRASVPFRVAP